MHHRDRLAAVLEVVPGAGGIVDLDVLVGRHGSTAKPHSTESKPISPFRTSNWTTPTTAPHSLHRNSTLMPSTAATMRPEHWTPAMVSCATIAMWPVRSLRSRSMSDFYHPPRWAAATTDGSRLFNLREKRCQQDCEYCDSNVDRAQRANQVPDGFQRLQSISFTPRDGTGLVTALPA